MHYLASRLSLASLLATACTIINSPARTSGEVATDSGSESSTAAGTSGSTEGGATETTAAAEESSTAADEEDGSSGDPAETSADTGMQPGEILFAADFDDALFPEYGFSYETITPGHSTHAAVPAGGPNGEDVCAYDMLPNEEAAQPYLGWSAVDLPNTELGVSRYIRLLFRIHSPCDGIGNFDVWGDKFIILGDGVPDPWGGVSRVIVGLGDPIDDTMRTTIARNIDGAEHGTRAVELTCGEWHWLQWEVRSSTTPETPDGGFKFWLDGDNDSYDAPTEVSPGFPLLSWIEEEQASAWNNLNLGFFAGTSLASGSIGFDFAAFEYGTAFDPSWHG